MFIKSYKIMRSQIVLKKTRNIDIKIFFFTIYFNFMKIKEKRKTPRAGLEPATWWLTATRSTG